MGKDIKTLAGKFELKGICGVLWAIKCTLNSLDKSICG
jgi:hypothetical protein